MENENKGEKQDCGSKFWKKFWKKKGFGYQVGFEEWFEAFQKEVELEDIKDLQMRLKCKLNVRVNVKELLKINFSKKVVQYSDEDEYEGFIQIVRKKDFIKMMKYFPVESKEQGEQWYKDLVHLCSKKWFWGPVTKEEAVRVLGRGEFIIRFSSQPGNFALSWCTQKGTYRTERIVYQNGTYTLQFGIRPVRPSLEGIADFFAQGSQPCQSPGRIYDAAFEEEDCATLYHDTKENDSSSSSFLEAVEEIRGGKLVWCTIYAGKVVIRRLNSNFETKKIVYEICEDFGIEENWKDYELVLRDFPDTPVNGTVTCDGNLDLEIRKRKKN